MRLFNFLGLSAILTIFFCGDVTCYVYTQQSSQIKNFMGVKPQYTRSPMLPNFGSHSKPSRTSRPHDNLQLSSTTSSSSTQKPANKLWNFYLKTTDLLTTLFPLWTVLFAGLAIKRPESFAWFSTKYFTASLGKKPKVYFSFFLFPFVLFSKALIYLFCLVFRSPHALYGHYFNT
jgi:hypothetical protein